MNKSPLGLAVGTALHQPPAPRYDPMREGFRRELERALVLLDEGRLGCLIITELQDIGGKTVLSTPSGNPSLIAQTAAHVLRSLSPPVEPT